MISKLSRTNCRKRFTRNAAGNSGSVLASSSFRISADAPGAAADAASVTASEPDASRHFLLLSLGLPSEDVFALSEELGRSPLLSRVPVFVLAGADVHADARERLASHLDRLVLHDAGSLESLLEQTRHLSAAAPHAPG